MINTVRNAVLALLNKHNYGYLAPGDFNMYAKLAQLDMFRHLFDRYNEILLKENLRESGIEYAGLNEKITRAIDRFVVPLTSLDHVTDNEFSLPSTITVGHEMYKPISVSCYDASVTPKVYKGEAEITSLSVIQGLRRSMLMAPSGVFPVVAMASSSLFAYPEDIFTDDGAIEMAYIRYPVEPRWTYISLSGGEPIFNPSTGDYADFELDPSFEIELVIKICQYAGIEVREADVYGFAKGEELQSKNIQQK